jgi:hypothetical protein
MISKKGVNKMIETPFKLDAPIDRWMSFHMLADLRTYIWYPSSVRQREWPSTTPYER